eukprot:jgi/Psemu1/179521/e_gw1.9.182.1
MEFRSVPNQPFQSERKYNVSLLVIDHYDSFTYNLVDMIAQITVDPPVVVAKDAFDFENAADRGDLSLFEAFDGIVLSPGPGTPQEQPPLSHTAISENPDVPILGVCLGHQLMSLAYGANVDRAPVPIHGQDHQIVHKHPWVIDGDDDNDDNDDDNSAGIRTPRYPSLFRGISSTFRVVRYHSLCAYDLPKSLAVTARSRDDVVQAIQHESNPHYGVQFHPESIGTENGMALLKNFVEVVEQTKQKQKQKQDCLAGGDCDDKDAARSVVSASEPTAGPSPDAGSNAEPSPRFRVMVHRIPSSEIPSVSPLRVFERLYARESHTIWLDSSSYHTGRGETDILAAPYRADDVVEYHIDENDGNGNDILSRLEKELFGTGSDGGDATPADTSIGWVEFGDDAEALEWVTENDIDGDAEDLPFNYRGGFLGFLGYEVRHDTQRYLQQLEGGVCKDDTTTGRNRNGSKDGGKNRVPTAAFFLARQSMVYHHPTDTWYLIGLAEQDDDIQENLEWMKQVGTDLKLTAERHSSSSAKSQIESRSSDSRESCRSPLEFVPNRSEETYKDDVAKCHEYIKKGDSYELCLTNNLEARVSGPAISTFELYKIIREVNPAPYSSYFRWNLSTGSTGDREEKAADVPSSTSLVICSSSPERFMSVSRKKPHPEIPPFLQAEAKPIKGTCARVMPQNGVCLTDAESREDDRRARSLELSIKNRAENLMIVDLLRNDMSRVCETGSVHVSKLMDIESFATVHQMVSTIRGTLSESCNSIDLLRASFPGGSMTGAPKIRTMEILEDLEENVDRGPYSGSLGYLSVNGCMDMNILIRSATVTPSDRKDEWKVGIGAGGAITALSEAEDEYDEMLLKARAVKEAVQRWAAFIPGDDDDDDGETVSGAEAAAPNATEAIVRT